MANRTEIRPQPNESRSGTTRPGFNGWLVVQAPANENHVGGIVLQSPNGTSTYLWADDTGDIRTSTTEPTLPNADGTVVGSQS